MIIQKASIVLIGTCFTTCLVGATQPSKKDKIENRPNILFIMVDEMRSDVMGCAGHPMVKTPNLDRLAETATRFSNAFTVSPMCCPSRKSFFTGRYAHTHGVVGNGITPNIGELDLPLILNYYGYETAISGKLHFFPDNFSWGFDKFWSYRNEGPGELESYQQYIKRNNVNTKIEEGSAPFPNDPLGKDIGKYTFPKEQLQSYWITDRSIEYLKSRKAGDKPFFLFTSFLEPHSPSRTTEPYFSMYDSNSIVAPKIPDKIKSERAVGLRDKLRSPTRTLVDNEEMVRRLTAIYLSHVTQVDDNIGRLMSTIKEQGLDKNTIIIFTSDHGNMLGDLGRWFKAVMYEGSTRIPLLIQMPDNIDFAKYTRKGEIEKRVVRNIDLMPTLLELAGINIPQGIEGTSMVPLLQGKNSKWNEDVYSEYKTIMYRTPYFKLIKSLGKNDKPDKFELYDMKNDPKELSDLIEDVRYKEIIEEYKNKLHEWQATKSQSVEIEGLIKPYYLSKKFDNVKINEE